MKNAFAFIVFSVVFIASCSKKTDPLLVDKGRVGLITNETTVKQLDSIFALDSIVTLSAENSLFLKSDQIEIYENDSTKLFLIIPRLNNNPYSKIASIHIFDSRYKTSKGITKESTFGDIKKHYTIAEVSHTLSSLIVTLEDNDFYFVFDKNVLPERFLNGYRGKIEAEDIPESAPVKFFMVSWEDTEK